MSNLQQVWNLSLKMPVPVPDPGDWAKFATRPLLSIVIVNWNTRDLLRACLRSIEMFPSHVGLDGVPEVIVVDNASSDESAALVVREFPWVSLLALPRNVGYAEGNNLGILASHGEFVLTLNPDTELNSSSLSPALELLESNPKIGCVGVKQIGVDAKVQRSVRGFPSLIGILGDVLKLSLGPLDSYRLFRFDYELEQPAPQPMGTYLMFRREALLPDTPPAPPFDPRFPIFFNEVDLLFRLSQQGWRCVYTPAASILHHGGESTKLVKPMMIWESHRSLIRYFLKNGSAAQKAGAVALSPLIYLSAFARAKGYHAGFRA